MACVPLAPASLAQAVITGAEGENLIVRSSGEIPVAPGTSCLEGDQLKVSTGSRLDISVLGTAGFRFFTHTEATLTRLSKLDMAVDLTSGNLAVKVPRRLAGFQLRIETPSAIITVKGTQFWVNASDVGTKKMTTVATREGQVKVTVKKTAESYTLQKGEAIDVSSDGLPPPEPRPALDIEANAAQQAEGIIIHTLRNSP